MLRAFNSSNVWEAPYSIKPAISHSLGMCIKLIRNVLDHKLSPLGDEGCHVPTMTTMLTILDSAVKQNKEGVLVVSPAVRKDPHLASFLPRLTSIFVASNHCASILNILHALNRPVEKNTHATSGLVKSVNRKESDSRRYFHLPFCPCSLEEFLSATAQPAGMTKVEVYICRREIALSQVSPDFFCLRVAGLQSGWVSLAKSEITSSRERHVIDKTIPGAITGTAVHFLCFLFILQPCHIQK